MTIGEWLLTIEEKDIRGKAFKNLNHKKADIEVESLPEAISRAFSWLNSQEGVDFWYEYVIELTEHKGVEWR